MNNHHVCVEILKQQLRAKEVYLQGANEKQETANAELSSSNEEMQSINKELATVNAELQTKVSEISRLNNDTYNFLMVQYLTLKPNYLA
jgi:two-component system CheB/CheR fusion protein